jgi:predicted amidohydrolase YtcJ
VRRVALVALLAAAAQVCAAASAELIVTGARIYTGAAARPWAQALAVAAGRLVYVGDAAGARAFAGPGTRIEDAHGRIVLPGLVDAHIHPLDIVDLDVCDLENKSLTLRQLSDFVRGCIAHYRPKPGEWLNVHLWAETGGNEPDAELPTLRAALDRASRDVPIQLMGEDGHHGAFNSAALALAQNAAGKRVGLSRATLARDFPDFAQWVGVDAHGEPNGAVNEDARAALTQTTMLYDDLEAVKKVPERIPQRLNSVGITAMLDAMAAPEGLPVYDELLARHLLTVHTNLALFYDPERFRGRDGRIDWDTMVARATAQRARYAGNPLLTADTVKLFADGGLEGNPFAVPPTLPNAAHLKPFLQPHFGVDAQGHSTVLGYIDTASALCTAVRAQPERYPAAQFLQTHGFHPAQCRIASGRLQHEPQVIMEFVRRFHLAGFNLHIHVISDETARVAVDALEAARAADGVQTRDALAHLQLAASPDIERIGRDHLYVAFTYAWATVERDYDMSVIPFIQPVQGNSYRALHVPGSYYEEHVYPVRSVQRAGAILVAGSDAPVETRDPRPFVNIARAMTRRLPGQPSLNAAQDISLEEALQAYTLNGARLLGREREIGSLEVGKAADFIIIDRDPFALAAHGRADDIAATRVIRTYFMGQQVYAAPSAGAGTS